MWIKNHEAYRRYMTDELGVIELSDSERAYIKKRLGMEIRFFRRSFVWLDRKMDKLLHIVKIDRMTEEAESMGR